MANPVKHSHVKIIIIIVVVFISGIFTNYLVFQFGFANNFNTMNNNQSTCILKPSGYVDQNGNPCSPPIGNSNNTIDTRVVRTVSSVVSNIDSFYNSTVTVSGNFSNAPIPRPALACMVPPSVIPNATYDNSYYTTPYNGNFLVEFHTGGINGSAGITPIATSYLPIEVIDKNGVPNPSVIIPLQNGKPITLTGKIVKAYVPEICASWKLHKSAFIIVDGGQVGLFWSQPANLIPFASLLR